MEGIGGGRENTKWILATKVNMKRKSNNVRSALLHMVTSMQMLPGGLLYLVSGTPFRASGSTLMILFVMMIY